MRKQHLKSTLVSMSVVRTTALAFASFCYINIILSLSTITYFFKLLILNAASSYNETLISRQLSPTHDVHLCDLCKRRDRETCRAEGVQGPTVRH
ncbi:hypothetical protein DER44DRAFT_755426, partial [Fusarium oxysporum]